MKKNYLLICLLLIASVGFSQTKDQNVLNLENSDGFIFQHKLLDGSSERLTSFNPYVHKKNTPNNKAFLDTLYYEDFDSLSALKWTITDINNNGNIWEWSKTYRAGNLLGAVNVIGSSTASNGFFSLPCDFYNSPLPAVPNEMETFITSPPLVLTKSAPGVFLQFQQYYARCCTSAPMMYLEVSSDSINWDSTVVQEDLGVNQANAFPPNPASTVTVNISRFAANKDTVWVRFRATQMQFYWWMLDDVVILEGPRHDLELSNPRVRLSSDNYAVNPYYTRVPYDLFTPAVFQGTIFNNGWDTSRNANLEVNVRRLNDLNGVFVDEHVYAQDQNVTDDALPPFPNGEIVTVDNLTFSPLSQGLFRATFEASSDSVDQIPGMEFDSLDFATTDTVYSKDLGQFFIGDNVTPAEITRGTSTGGSDGDAVGTVFTIEPRSSSTVIPTSVSFFISRDNAVDGIRISPSIWGFNENSATFDSLWLPEDFNNNSGYGLLMFGDVYQVQLADTNTFLTLPLDTAGFTGLDSGTYVVGWEVIGGSQSDGSVYFSVVNDISNSRQPFLSSMMAHGSTSEKFYHNPNFTSFQPLIRLNIATLPIQTSVDDPTNSKSDYFDVIPNPSTGQIKINLSVESTAIYNLSVTNMIGQVVYTDLLPVNGAVTERIDLSSLEKGVYFVTLENTNERLTQKIILK